MAEFEQKPDQREYSPRQIKLPAPQAGIFDSPTVTLCVNKKWASFVHGVLSVLESGQYWLGDSEEIERIEQEIYKLQMALGGLLGGQCGADFPQEGETCHTYNPNAYIISYAPNDPFQTPNHTPSGYLSPPWVSGANLLNELLGAQDSDVFCGAWMVNEAGAFNPFNPTNFLDFIIDAIGIISSGFPRFEIRMSGEGTATIKLLALPFGGQAWVSVDNSPAQIVDTFSVSLNSVTELNDWIELIMGAIITDDNLIEERIIELDIVGSGEHQIDVTFVPIFGLDGNIGWGGGLREVTLCNEQLIGVSNQMPQFRVNQETLNVEWKPTELHTEYEPLGQVIYPIAMQTDIDPISQNPKLQWTLQPVAIGGGANPFEQWLDLAEIQAGNDGLNIELRVSGGFVQWSLQGANSWQNLFEVPSDGNDGNDGLNIELRVSGGFVQWSLQGANSWQNLFEVPSDGNDGISPTFEWVGNVLKIDTNGDNLPDVESPPLKGDPADCGCNDSPPSDQTESSANRCGKALYLQDFVWTVYQEIRTKYELGLQTADTISTVIGALPAIGWAIDGVYDALSAMVQLGTLAPLDAQDTLANREALQQAWYCLLDESDQLNDAQYEALRDAIPNVLPTPLGEIIQGAFLSVSRAEMRRRAWLGAKNGGSCAGFECGGETVFDWCYEWDLAIEQYDWIVPDYKSGYAVVGYYSLADGWRLGNYWFGSTVIFGREFTGSVGKIEVDIYNGNDSYNWTNRVEVGAEVPESNGAYNMQYVEDNGDFTHKFKVEGALDFTGNMNLNISNSETTGFWAVRRVRIFGNGTNPFGESNC